MINKLIAVSVTMSVAMVLLVVFHLHIPTAVLAGLSSALALGIADHRGRPAS